MPKTTPPINSFNGGELSPLLDSRFDINKYFTGCRTLENMVPLVEGGASRMPGTYYVTSTKSNAVARLVPFHFNTVQAYVLEFGDQYIRFYRNNGQILSGPNPYEISTPYLEADLFELDVKTQSADILYIFHSEYAPRKLSRTGHTSWTLELLDIKNGPFRESVTYPKITPTGIVGTITLTTTGFGLPVFSGAGLNDGTFGGTFTGTSKIYFKVQIDTVAATDKFKWSDDNGVTWDATGVSITGAAQTLSNGVTITFGATTGHTLGNYWTITAEPVFNSDHVGAIWKIGHSVSATIFTNNGSSDDSGNWVLVDCTMVQTLNAGAGVDAGNYYYTITEAAATQRISRVATGTGINTNYRLRVWIKNGTGTWAGATLSVMDNPLSTTFASIPLATAAAWTEYVCLFSSNSGNPRIVIDLALGAGATALLGKIQIENADSNAVVETYGVVKIATVASALSATATVLQDLGATTASANQAEAAWSTYRGWPSCGTFFEQRLWAARDQTLWASASGDFEDFGMDAHDASAGIEYTIPSRKVDVIRWLSAQDYLMAGTFSGVWKIGAQSTTDPLTMDNVSAKKQVTIGAGAISPEVVADALLWVSRSGMAVRQLVYSYEVEKYIAPDMTRVAKHIAKGLTLATSGIKQMDFQSEPQPILWSLRKDGQLLGMTYEIQEQIYAWFRVKLDGDIESVAVISADNSEDQVWVVVKRKIGVSTVRYVEYFKPHDFFSEIKDCFFVETGYTFDGGSKKTITGITQGNPAVVTSASHGFTNGMKVKITAVVGMTQVNCGLTKAYTVAGAAANTFQLSGIDSTGWSAYTSGGEAQRVTNSIMTLTHLASTTVDILIDGALHVQKAVTAAGVLSLNWYGNKIHVGIPNTAILEPMKLNAGSPTGTSRGKKQKINKLTVAFYESYNCKVGPDQDNLLNIAFGTGETPALFTGDKDIDGLGDWDTEATISIVQDRPMPLTVLAIIPRVTVNDD